MNLLIRSQMLYPIELRMQPRGGFFARLAPRGKRNLRARLTFVAHGCGVGAA